MLAFSYEGDCIYVDGFHGVFDGTGLFYVAKTLLYYYCTAKYGKALQVPDLAKVGDVIEPDEYRDPYLLYTERQIADSAGKKGKYTPAKKTGKAKTKKKNGGKSEAFRLNADGRMKTERRRCFRLQIPQQDLIRCVKSNDGSPATSIPLFLGRAIHELHPQNEKDIVLLIPMNLRPVFGIGHAHHSFTADAKLNFGRRVWALNPETQGTIFRGMVIRQSDPDELHKAFDNNLKFDQLLKKIPFLSIKRKLMGGLAGMEMTKVTSSISYTGKCNFGDMEQYIREFYVEADGYGTGIAVEISAINDSFFISWNQDYWEKDYFDAFLKQLTEFGINYTVTYDGPFTISNIIAPWEKTVQ